MTCLVSLSESQGRQGRVCCRHGAVDLLRSMRCVSVVVGHLSSLGTKRHLTSGGSEGRNSTVSVGTGCQTCRTRKQSAVRGSDATELRVE